MTGSVRMLTSTVAHSMQHAHAQYRYIKFNTLKFYNLRSCEAVISPKSIQTATLNLEKYATNSMDQTKRIENM